VYLSCIIVRKCLNHLSGCNVEVNFVTALTNIVETVRHFCYFNTVRCIAVFACAYFCCEEEVIYRIFCIEVNQVEVQNFV